MLDDTILAGGIHRLQNDQDGMAIARPKQFLGRGQFGEIRFEYLRRPLLDGFLAGLFQFGRLRPTGIVIPQTHFLAGRNAHLVDGFLLDHEGSPFDVGRVSIASLQYGVLAAYPQVSASELDLSDQLDSIGIHSECGISGRQPGRQGSGRRDEYPVERIAVEPGKAETGLSSVMFWASRPVLIKPGRP